MVMELLGRHHPRRGLAVGEGLGDLGRHLPEPWRDHYQRSCLLVRLCLE